MFGPSWIHEKAEKPDGPVYEEIFCKVFYANPKAFLRLLKTSIFVSFGKQAQHQKVARYNKNSLIKAFLIGKDWENTVNNMGVVKKGCTIMCAPAIVNLYKQTKVDLFFNMEETLSYDKLWPTFKNSQCQLNRLLKVPLGSLLLHNELADNTRSTLHVQHKLFTHFTRIFTSTHRSKQ